MAQVSIGICLVSSVGAFRIETVNSLEVDDSQWTPVRGQWAIYGLDNTPALPAAECVTNQHSGEGYKFGDAVPDSCCHMAVIGGAESHFSHREAPCALFPGKYQPAAFQSPLFTTAYCDSSNHMIYEELGCQQTDDRCASCGNTFSHDLSAPICVKITNFDFIGDPMQYYGWFEGCGHHTHHYNSLVEAAEKETNLMVDTSKSQWMHVRGRWAIYGLENTPALPAAECVTNQHSGDGYNFGDVVPDSCCHMAVIGGGESHFSHREAPCALFPAKYQPASFQSPLFTTAYCDSSNHMIYEELGCQQTDDRCASCGNTFSHDLSAPICVKITNFDFIGDPKQHYGWFEGCADSQH